MSTLRERLRQLRATTRASERPPREVVGIPRSAVLEMRLSEAIRAGGRLRIHSRLLGEDIVICQDNHATDSDDAVPTLSVSEIIEMLSGETTTILL